MSEYTGVIWIDYFGTTWFRCPICNEEFDSFDKYDHHRAENMLNPNHLLEEDK